MTLKSISYDDVRQFLATRTQVKSSFGSQLDQLRDGVSLGGSRDAKRAQAYDEVERLHLAQMIRCVEGLCNTPSIRYIWIPDLRKFASDVGMGDGEAAVRVLYAYEPWDPQWPEAGLAQTYEWMCTKNTRLRALDCGSELAAQNFRIGKHKEARRRACALVADAHLALQGWMRSWAVKEARRHAA